MPDTDASGHARADAAASDGAEGREEGGGRERKGAEGERKGVDGEGGRGRKGGRKRTHRNGDGRRRHCCNAALLQVRARYKSAEMFGRGKAPLFAPGAVKIVISDKGLKDLPSELCTGAGARARRIRRGA